MTSMKTQIFQAVEQMDDDTAFSLWDMLVRHFDTPNKKISWDDIAEAEPDAIDLEMIKAAENDYDSHVYTSRDDLIARRRKRHK